MSLCAKMISMRQDNKGIALYFVLAILLVVVILANVILTFISSQTRLTGHQVKRIQAYYAAQAGMTFALEMLRTNAPGWTATTAFTKTLCSSTTPAAIPCDHTETSFPASINYVEIQIGSVDATTQLRTIDTVVNYTSVY